MSPRDPPTSIKAASKRAYASTTHCTSTTVALRLACSAGKARLTTLPSMKAMLDPRIVAARIQGAASEEHGVRAGEDRITPSSHGCPSEGCHFMAQRSALLVLARLPVDRDPER